MLNWLDIFEDFFQNRSRKVLDGAQFSTDVVDINLFFNRTLFIADNPKKIKNFTFKGQHFRGFELDGNLIFENCSFDYEPLVNYFDIKQIKADILHFVNCTFNRLRLAEIECEHILIDKTRVTNNLGLEKLVVNNFRFIGNGMSLSNLIITNCPELETVVFLNTEIESIHIKRDTPKSIFFGTGKYGSFHFDSKARLNNLKFQNFDNTSEELIIQDFRMYNTDISDKLEFIGCNIQRVSFVNLPNHDGQIIFRNSVISDRFEMLETNVNKTILTNMNLTTCKIYFDKSFLQDLKYSNIKWGEQFGIDSHELDENKFSALVEVFRQLKCVAQTNNNLFDKLKFQRLENYYYQQKVKHDKTEKSTDRFLLWVDKVFSNFGQDWLRPLGWMVGIQLVLCVLIWWRESWFHAYQPSSMLAAFEAGLSQYLTMLIPVFKTPDYWTGTSISISIIIRLFNALMIYYFIRAVHKFGKVN